MQKPFVWKWLLWRKLWGKICLIVVERFVFLGTSLCGQNYWATHLWLQVLSVPLPQMYRIKNTDMQSAFIRLWKDASFWRAQWSWVWCCNRMPPLQQSSLWNVLVDIPPSTVSGAVTKSLLGLQTCPGISTETASGTVLHGFQGPSSSCMFDE